MKTRTTHYEDIYDVEIEFEFEPVSDVLREKLGDKIIVAYLAHDTDPENPMKAWDGEGELFTKPERYGGGSITDTPSWGSYLGLDSDGDMNLELDEVVTLASNLWCNALAANEEAKPLLDKAILECESNVEEITADLWELANWGHNFTKFKWDNPEDEALLDLLPPVESFKLDAWAQLYDEGGIGEPLAVPVRWYSSCHGPGTARAHTASVDDCNAVWVPGKFEIENMSFPENATLADKRRVAEKYAEGVLETYISWCNGDVYGCVVQTHDAESGEMVDSDSCWGFYGMDYAEESLKSEFFEPAVERCRKEIA